MRVEVVVPAIRPRIAERLLYSLSKQTRPADHISLVSNELERIETYGLPVEQLHFHSDVYGYGDSDAGLRRNIGIFDTDADVIITQDDDELSPPTMIEDVLRVLETEPYCWGHHRFISFDQPWDDILALPPEAGESRESYVNANHLYLSCYAGMFGAWRETVTDVGGFDMVFNGRHANEDQALGRRLSGVTTTVFIHEPPFSWHPSDRSRTWLPTKTNLCDGHVMQLTTIDGVQVAECQRCPRRELVDVQRALMSRDNILSYDHSLVTVTRTNPGN